jgi:hypothetical protein
VGVADGVAVSVGTVVSVSVGVMAGAAVSVGLGVLVMVSVAVGVRVSVGWASGATWIVPFVPVTPAIRAWFVSAALSLLIVSG